MSGREVFEAGVLLKRSTEIRVALAFARNPVPSSREAAKIGILPKGPPAVMSGREVFEAGVLPKGRQLYNDKRLPSTTHISG